MGKCLDYWYTKIVSIAQVKVDKVDFHKEAK